MKMNRALLTVIPLNRVKLNAQNTYAMTPNMSSYNTPQTHQMIRDYRSLAIL